MLGKMINKKTNLFTLSLFVISISAILLAAGYLIGASISFLLGFATSTMVLGFGMMIASFIAKVKTGKVPKAAFDERENSIAYIAGFTTYIITIFGLCLFTFAAFSSKFVIDISAKTLAVVVLCSMSAIFFISMAIYRKLM